MTEHTRRSEQKAAVRGHHLQLDNGWLLSTSNVFEVGNCRGKSSAELVDTRMTIPLLGDHRVPTVLTVSSRIRSCKPSNTTVRLGQHTQSINFGQGIYFVKQPAVGTSLMHAASSS